MVRALCRSAARGRVLEPEPGISQGRSRISRIRTAAARGLATALVALYSGPASAASTAVSPPASVYASAPCAAVDTGEVAQLRELGGRADGLGRSDERRAPGGRVASRIAGRAAARTGSSPRTPPPGARAGSSARSRSAPVPRLRLHPAHTSTISGRRTGGSRSTRGRRATRRPAAPCTRCPSRSTRIPTPTTRGRPQAVGAAAAYDGGGSGRTSRP